MRTYFKATQEKRAWLKEQWKLENEFIRKGETEREEARMRIIRNWEDKKLKEYLKVLKN